MSWYDNLVNPKPIKALGGNIEAPPGFNETSKPKSTPVVRSQSSIDSLKVKKAWDIATGPAKQIPMNLFMSYMSGNSLQIIPITMTITLFTGAFSAIIGVNSQFRGLESDKTSSDILLAKLTFIFFQLVVIGIGVYKLNSMGLIPNKAGDWLSWDVPTEYVERVL